MIKVKAFLDDLKADLLDRRLMPLVMLACLGLVGAVAYVALGGSSSSGGGATESASIPVPAGLSASGGVPVSEVTPETSLAETTSGGSSQHTGNSHNPFEPIPGAASHVSKPSTAAATTTSSSSAASSPSSSSATETSKSTTPTEAPAKKTQTIYDVSVLFGTVPLGVSSGTVQLEPFESIKLLTPFPAHPKPLLVYRGVTAHGKAATFTVVGEVILHGAASCLPSETQCEAIDLQAGKDEQLEYLEEGAQAATVYELRVVSIEPTKASTASVKHYLRAVSRSGHHALVQSGRVKLPFLVQSGQPGVLVFPSRGAFGARAARLRRAVR